MNTLVRVAALLCIALSAACAPLPSYDDLQAEAEATGDWSEVERYERMMARRDLRRTPSCPAGQTLYCEALLGSERCMCARTDTMRTLVSTR